MNLPLPEVVSFKKSLEGKPKSKDEKKKKVAVHSIVSAYAIIKPSKKSEAINETLVSNCIYVHDYVLKPYPEIAKLIQMSDDRWGNDGSLSKVGILAAIARRGKQSRETPWLFQSLIDAMSAQEIAAGALVEKDITGKGLYGKAIVDLILIKKEALTHLLGSFLDNIKIMPVDIKKLSDITFKTIANIGSPFLSQKCHHQGD